MKSSIIAMAAIACLSLSGSSISSIVDKVESPISTADLDVHESNGSVSLLGQFRTSVTSWLWLRTDLYLHNGVEMRPLTDGEVRNGRTGVGSADHQELAAIDADKLVTVIPAKSEDFRGILGDLERATRAYKDMAMHTHNDPETAFPLFRLMTWIDPNFVPGWTSGASLIARKSTRRAIVQSLEFLQVGLQYNPASIPILVQLGSLNAGRLRRFDVALRYLQKATEVGQKPRLTEDDNESLVDGYRWLALIYREQHEPELLAHVLREGLKRFPDDRVLMRLSARKAEIRKSPS